MKNPDKKIALFDFCETLVKFQSADKFIKYVKVKEHIKPNYFYIISNVLEKTKLSAILFRLHININKFLLLKSLQGISEDCINKNAQLYYNEIVRPNIIQDVLYELKNKQKSGYRIIIVSGGYDVYLKYFKEEFNIDDLICSTLQFNNKTFTGRLNGPDCIGKEKIRLLKEKFDITNDLKNWDSISYSDSKSDLPLLNFTKKSIVVTHQSSRWALKHKFKILIWKK